MWPWLSLRGALPTAHGRESRAERAWLSRGRRGLHSGCDGQGARGRVPKKALRSRVGGLRLGGAAAVLAEVHLRECEVSGRSLPARQEAGEDEEEAGDPRDHAG